MKFADVLRGTRAVKVIDFPQDNTRCELLADLPELAAQRAADRAERAAAHPEQAAPEDSPAIKVGLRVLSGVEAAEVLQKSRAFAIARGIAAPTEGDRLYDLAIQAHTLALACVDVDSPEKAREPFFDGGPDQILRELDVDRIAYIFERQMIWQDECSPSALKLSTKDAYAHITRTVVSSDDLPFSQMSRGLQWTLFRFMGSQLLNYLADKWPSILASGELDKDVTALISKHAAN